MAVSSKLPLYLIDSSIYVFQAWFSLPDTLSNVDGEPNNAWLGFTDFTYRFLTQAKPRHLVFAFDESLKSSARNDIYPQYKANRAPAPVELKRQFQWCRAWLDALGITQVASNRHEADDLIGSLAHFQRDQHSQVILLTADKDLAQLVGKDDIWWSFANGQQLNYRALTKRFGVRPEQIADQLALAGDKVDNIPGIPGIGMAIAARLLTRFETLDNPRQNVDQVGQMKFRGAQRVMNLLREHESILDISARLTPINCSIESMATVPTLQTQADREQIQAIMDTQQMGASRRSKWMNWLDTRTL